jgi:hypothetical protein
MRRIALILVVICLTLFVCTFNNASATPIEVLSQTGLGSLVYNGDGSITVGASAQATSGIGEGPVYAESYVDLLLEFQRDEILIDYHLTSANAGSIWERGFLLLKDLNTGETMLNKSFMLPGNLSFFFEVDRTHDYEFRIEAWVEAWSDSRGVGNWARITAVPEPTSMLLLGLGLIGLAGIRRKFKN